MWTAWVQRNIHCRAVACLTHLCVEHNQDLDCCTSRRSPSDTLVTILSTHYIMDLMLRLYGRVFLTTLNFSIIWKIRIRIRCNTEKDTRRKKSCCINQPDCWYRTDKTFLFSQQIFSFPNKPIFWNNKRVCYCFLLDKTFCKENQNFVETAKKSLSVLYFPPCIWHFISDKIINVFSHFYLFFYILYHLEIFIINKITNMPSK